jgi:hypothetical protein
MSPTVPHHILGLFKTSTGRNMGTTSVGGAPIKIGDFVMVDKASHTSTGVSRRSVLLHGALCATGAATIFVANIDSARAAKLPQTSVAYRTAPNGNKECSDCKFFMAPDSCQKVAGKISPRGYCILWQKA